jgi:hypothetical protein
MPITPGRVRRPTTGTTSKIERPSDRIELHRHQIERPSDRIELHRHQIERPSDRIERLSIESTRSNLARRPTTRPQIPR